MSDYDEVRSRATKRAKERATGTTYKMEVGVNEFRPLYTPKGKNSPSVYFEFAVHENVGPEKAYLRCGIDPTTGKGRCYTCQKKIPMLIKRGKESRAAELEPKTKLVMQVAKVIKSKPRGKPLLWYPSPKIGDAMVGTIIPSKKRDYISHKKGYNLSVTRTGTGMKDTRYGPIEADQEPSKVPQEIIDLLKPFDQLTSIPKYDEKKMKIALGDANMDDEDEDDEPKNSKKRGRDEDDDEDDEEDEDSDDDGDADDEDDDDEDGDEDSDGDDEEDESDDNSEDEDDDEDDEDDEPKKKPKSSKSKQVKKKKRR